MTEVRDPQALPRLQSIDAYRGFVIFLMLTEVLHLHVAARQFPDSTFWRWLNFHTSHVAWRGCSLHDLVQPSFCFLVGVALPFSLASRLARGQSRCALAWHAAWRSLVLVLLGISLHSIGEPRTNFIFTDTLTLIGLGYFPLFLLGLLPRSWLWAALAAILGGYRAAFALYPSPTGSFDYSAVGVPADWPHHVQGFAAQWNKNSNLAWAFDTWWMNLFPRATPFTHNPGGYATLNFIPTVGTMILGLLAGGWLRDGSSSRDKARRLAIAGITLLALGLTLDRLGICPSVKRIWTPAWVLVSGGCCHLLLAGFYWVIDVLEIRSWSIPFRILGANALVAYVMLHSLESFLISTIHCHLGTSAFRVFGDSHQASLTGVAVLLIYFAILTWLYRQKIFVKI